MDTSLRFRFWPGYSTQEHLERFGMDLIQKFNIIAMLKYSSGKQIALFNGTQGLTQVLDEHSFPADPTHSPLFFKPAKEIIYCSGWHQGVVNAYYRNNLFPELAIFDHDLRDYAYNIFADRWDIIMTMSPYRIREDKPEATISFDFSDRLRYLRECINSL